jgi:hypothetical protein
MPQAPAAHRQSAERCWLRSPRTVGRQSVLPGFWPRGFLWAMLPALMGGLFHAPRGRMMVMRQLLIICALGIVLGLFWGLLAVNGASTLLMMVVGGASGIVIGLTYKALRGS